MTKEFEVDLHRAVAFENLQLDNARRLLRECDKKFEEAKGQDNLEELVEFNERAITKVDAIIAGMGREIRRVCVKHGRTNPEEVRALIEHLKEGKKRVHNLRSHKRLAG